MKKFILVGVVTLGIMTLSPQSALAITQENQYEYIAESINDNLITQINNDGSVIQCLSKEAQDTNIQEQIDAQINKTHLLRSPTWINYSYKTEAIKYVSAEGVAGGQPSIGTKFKTGGGFAYNPSGGPNASVGVGWAGLSISTNLGTATANTVGYTVSAPNKTQFFKCHVKKTYRVDKVAVYACPYTQPNKPQFQYYIYPQTYHSQELSARVVK